MRSEHNHENSSGLLSIYCVLDTVISALYTLFPAILTILQDNNTMIPIL